MKAAIRWILTPVAGILGWYVAVLLGIGIYSVGLLLCPSTAMLSGSCLAPGFIYFMDVVTAVCAGLAAALAMVFSTYTAPSKRRWVVWVTLVLGIAIASGMVAFTKMWAEWLCAMVAGGVTTWVLLRRFPT